MSMCNWEGWAKKWLSTFFPKQNLRTRIQFYGWQSHNLSNVRQATVGEAIWTLPLEIKWGGISESLERAVCVTLQKKIEKKGKQPNLRDESSLWWTAGDGCISCNSHWMRTPRSSSFPSLWLIFVLLHWCLSFHSADYSSGMREVV